MIKEDLYTLEKPAVCKICKAEIKIDDLCSAFNDGFACLKCSIKLNYLKNKNPYYPI